MCDFNPTVMLDAMQEAQIKLLECGVDLSRYCYKMSQTTFDKLCKYNKQVLVSWDESADPKCFGLPVEVDEQISECKVLLMARAVGG